MVMAYHYSRRIPSNVQLVGSLHMDGGLFGGDGEMVAACFFSIPPTRWAEPVLELSRLVRGERQVPLTYLIAECVKTLRKHSYDLLVSFADRTYGHEGYVYRAANWRYAGCREKRIDGVVVDGQFIGGRAVNHKYGTQSVERLRQIMPDRNILAHYDEGKHCFYLPLNKAGEKKAERLGLKGDK